MPHEMHFLLVESKAVDGGGGDTGDDELQLCVKSDDAVSPATGRVDPDARANSSIMRATKGEAESRSSTTYLRVNML